GRTVPAPVDERVLHESTAELRKYFGREEIVPPTPEGWRQVPPAGRLGTGMPELPRTPQWPSERGEPVFFNSVYRNDPVRVVALVRDLYYRGGHRQVLILVAESIGRRLQVESAARRQELLRDARMLALVGILVWWGVAG